MWVFLVLSLFPAFLLFLGAKAVATSQIDPVKDVTLGPKASLVLGMLTIVFSVGLIVFLFAFLILRWI